MASAFPEEFPSSPVSPSASVLGPTAPAGFLAVSAFVGSALPAVSADAVAVTHDAGPAMWSA